MYQECKKGYAASPAKGKKDFDTLRKSHKEVGDLIMFGLRFKGQFTQNILLAQPQIKHKNMELLICVFTISKFGETYYRSKSSS